MEAEPKKGLGTLDKILIGCGLGCGVLIVAAVVAAVLGTVWFFSPGEQIATESIVGSDSLGFVRLHELATDPGTQELLTRFLVRLDEVNRERQREDLPPSLRWINDLQGGQQGDRARGMNLLIPREATVAFERAGEEDDLDFVVAANPRTMVRVFRAMFGLIGRLEEEGEIASSYRGHDLYRLEDDAALAFARGTLLISNSAGALERAIDRVEAGAAAGGMARGLSRVIPPGEWDVDGALGNEAGLVEGLLLALPAPVEAAGGPAADLEELVESAGGELRLGFGLDVASADEISGRAVLECGDPRTAAGLVPALAERYRALTAGAAEQGLELEADVRAEGVRAVSDLRLTGLEALIDELVSEMAEGPEEPAADGEPES